MSEQKKNFDLYLFYKKHYDFSYYELIEMNIINIHEVDELNGTALTDAADQNDVRLVSLILRKGGNINHKDRFGRCALGMAIHNKSPEMIETLLEYKPNMFNVNFYGDSALIFALRVNEYWKSDDRWKSKSMEVLNLILKYLLESGDQEYMSCYRLCAAMIHDDIESVKRQLSEIEDVNFGKVKTGIPLVYAVESNKLDIAKFLLESGMTFKPDENFKRKSLFHCCLDCRRGKVEMLELLIKFEANFPSDILYLACQRRLWDCARLLTKYFADVNYYGSDGRTPFLVACRFADVETLKVMVESGAHFDTKINHGYYKGKTVLHLAAENESSDSFFYIANS